MKLQDGGEFDGMRMDELRMHAQVKSTHQYPEYFKQERRIAKDHRNYVGYAHFLLMLSMLEYIPVCTMILVVPSEQIHQLAAAIFEAIEPTQCLDFATRMRIGLSVRGIVCGLLQVDMGALSRMGLTQYLGLTLEAIAMMCLTPKEIPDMLHWLTVLYMPTVVPPGDRVVTGLVNFAQRLVAALIAASGIDLATDLPDNFYVESSAMLVHACKARRNVVNVGDAIFTQEACQDVLLRLRKKLAQVALQETIIGRADTEGGFAVQPPRAPEARPNINY